VKAATNAETRLFDASAILLLAKRSPEQASTILENQFRLDLTIYEIGNAVWKINKLINKSKKLTALDAIEQAYNMTALMDVRRVEEIEEIMGAMDLAYEYNLTFYDSCYLFTAAKIGVTLVSEDRAIIEATRRKGVKCISATECVSST
jgi:predicted nucleic acid-binding protein